MSRSSGGLGGGGKAMALAPRCRYLQGVPYIFPDFQILWMVWYGMVWYVQPPQLGGAEANTAYFITRWLHRVL